jgi:hypothetical protein
LICISFTLAILPALLFLINLFYYREPQNHGVLSLGVSILIPARDEENCIADCVRSALATEGANIEVLVLNDGSIDKTADIVRGIAADDPRVSLIQGEPLPAGWCGKQFACATLARMATKQYLCFLDADVRIHPSAVARLVGLMHTQKLSLLSGFPRQITVTFFEQLLLPLMHFLLLGYLPLIGMRKSASPAFGAGCGQLLCAERNAYEHSGGHSAIKSSRHDGLTLPKAFRKSGFRTGICDITRFASCRMYRTGNQVILGLLKNADEGLAAPARIIPFSIMLLFGHCLPVVLLAIAFFTQASTYIQGAAAFAVLASFLPRLVAVIRFEQPFMAALLHPLAVLVFLAMQWFASIQSLRKIPTSWKGREYSTP